MPRGPSYSNVTASSPRLYKLSLQPNSAPERNLLASTVMIRSTITAAAILAGSSAVCLYLFHQRLSSRVEHVSQSGKLGLTKSRPISIESVPDDVFTDNCFALHDRASKSVSSDALPANIPVELLLTKLLRRNMITFTRLPQALAMKLSSRSLDERHSFDPALINSLEFKEGDLVCGVYRVIVRKDHKVEFEMKMKGMEFLNGRLATSISQTGDQVVFSTETFMWRQTNDTRKMPLERPLVRWMHETASWWLIDSGVDYLKNLNL